MKDSTKHKLRLAWASCDYMDKSTEYTMQFMADYAGVEYMVAVDFMADNTAEESQKWYNENPNWLKEYESQT